jgi:hypothetical protein
MKTISVPEKEQLSFGAQSILESVEKKWEKFPICMQPLVIHHPL